MEMETVVEPAGQRPPSQSNAWRDLKSHLQEIRDQPLRALFAADPDRGDRMTAEGAGIFLDYSKNRVTGRTMTLLFELARECSLRARIDAMFSGGKINTTEKRAVLHVALRMPR